MMNGKQLLSLLIFTLFLGSCTVISELKLQSKSNFKEDNVQTIPFRYVKQLIIVDASINNTNYLSSFIFDTGAFQSKVEYQLAEKLQLATVMRRDNGTAQGIKREIEITSIDSLALGGDKFYNIGAGKLKYDSKSYSSCVAKDGILGSNLIKLAHWKIDYANREMKVSQTPFKEAITSKNHRLPFSTSFLSGVPKIAVQVEGQTIEDVIFDSGYNGGLVLPRQYANRFETSNTQTLIDQSTAGIFGSNRDTLWVKRLTVELGGVKTKIPVEFSSLNKALLGNDVLEHFTVYLDYDEKMILLIPNSEVRVDSPLRFIPGILNDSFWVVNRSTPQLPLKIGDTLTSINGHKPKDVFASHCDYFFRLSEFLNSDTLVVKNHRTNAIINIH